MLTRRIHSIILLLALLIGGVGMNYVQAQTSGSCGTSVTWSLNTSTGRLTISGTGAMANWAISNNRPPWYASYREQITSVVINSGVTTIGKYAFCGCTNLTSVTIPNTVTTIYDYAFEEDAKLTSITIPNSVTYIGYYAFWLCSGLRTVTMSNQVKTIQGVAFSGCSSLKSITLPNTVTTLGISVFSNCTSLTSVNIPTGLTELRGYTFKGCTALTSIVIPANIKSIRVEAFSGCSALTSVTLPNTLTTMETDVFLNCTSLTSVNIPTGLTILPARTFQGCIALTSISIPANIQTIGKDVFKNINALRDVYVYWTTASAIPDWNSMLTTYTTTLHVPCGKGDIYDEKVGWGSCTIVGNTQYTITGKTTDANGTVSIDGGTAGTNVSKTTTCDSEVMLTATPGSDCRYAFIKWTDGVTTNPRTVTVSRNATYTAQFGIATPQGNCGANGNNLTWSLNRCTGVLTISGSGAMKDWSAETDVPWYIYAPDITSVVLPVGLTHIGANAFYGCAITKIDIPAAVRTFGTRAFFSSSLREICIPEGVTTLPNELFGGHIASTAPLERIYLPGTLTSMYNIGLAYTHLQTLTIPKSVTDNSIVIHWRYNYIPKNIYVSWTENIPKHGGRLEAANPNVTKMHVPYGTTSQYSGWSTEKWSRVCGIVEDVDERAIDLGLSIRWASCNIGATAPEENGNFYAWGDTLTRSSFTWGTYPYSGTSTNTMTKYCTRAANGTVDNRSTLIAFDDAAYINWGETWRMPTWTEWNELITRCTWKETTINNVSVWQVTGPNGNSIYLPKTGYKANSSVTAGCYYWSSTLNTANSNDQCNRALYINAASRTSAKYGLRCVGMPIRAVYRREWPSFTLTITDTPEGTSYTKAINAAVTYTLTAQEDDCHRFVRWSDGNTNKTRTVTVTANATYTAVYETIQYTVTVQAADPTMGDVMITIP